MGRRAAWALVLAPVVAVLTVLGVAVVVVFGDEASGGGQVPNTGVTGGQLRDGITDIPPQILALIRGAVAEDGCPQLTESVLAAQLKQESGFRADAVSSASAQGIAQFTPPTWATWGRDENGNGTASPFEPEDAIPAAARFDCAIAKSVADLPGDPAALMLAGYNAGPGAVRAWGGVPPFEETVHYVRAVLALSAKWGTQSGLIGAGHGLPPGAGIEVTGNQVIDTAVSWAVAQIGSWYHFGGDCTDPFSDDIATRCDCSSLMQQAYSHAGLALPRTAAEQSREGAEVSMADLRPGDLVASIGSDGTRAAPGHIAMYVGGGNVVEAPFEGRQVHLFPVSGYHDIVTIRRIVT